MIEISPHSRRTFSTRSWAALGVTLIACLQAACFDGLGAKGLECEDSTDCGPMLACDMNTHCCGGECLFPGDTDTTTSTSATTSSTTDSTTTGTDTTATTGGIETTGGIACGNGQVDDDEDCDPGTPGMDTKDCDSDCTRPICGDGYKNEAAGELEDDLTPGEEKLSCILFGAEAEAVGEVGFNDVWATGTLVYDDDNAPPELRSWDEYHAPGPPPEPRWRFASGSGGAYWGSGPYLGCYQSPFVDCPGTLVWMETERCIPLPAEIEDLPTHLGVQFEHAAGFNAEDDFGADGGRAWVLYYADAECEGQPVRAPLAPPGASLACDCYEDGVAGGVQVCEGAECPCKGTNCSNGECYSLGEIDGPNPAAGQPAFFDQSTTTYEASRPHVPPGLPQARAIRLRFEAAYSCRRNPDSVADTWKVFNATIKLLDGEPPPG